MRERTACMMRVKNERRWIRKSLECTWQVAARVVIFDDGSTDDTCIQAVATLGDEWESDGGIGFDGGYDEAPIAVYQASDVPTRELHFIRSPFANASVRPEERVNEIRDKNALWYYMKSNVPFEHVLCLDGDEALSLEALRCWPQVVAALDRNVDIVQLPFVYLWDGEDRQRVDGVYGAPVDGDGACLTCRTVDCASPRHKRLRFPRVFTVKRLAPREFFDMRFEWTGTRGGFHCGSVPQEAFRPGGKPPVIAFAEAPVIHYGYVDDALRRQKFDFYNHLDPGNVFEGEYKHIIGEPDRLAPGPVRLAPWEDT